MSELKTCTKCKAVLPATLEYFHKNAANKSGMAHQCKECGRKYAREYVASHREERREYQREYVKSDPEKARSITRKYALANRDKNREKDKARRLANLEKARAKDRKYRENNREKIVKTVRAYQERNPEMMRKHWRIKRERKRNAPGQYTKADLDLAFKSQNGKCWHCGVLLGADRHTDHLIPLSRGGSNYPENIVLSCPKCNLSKGSKLTTEWNGRLF